MSRKGARPSAVEAKSEEPADERRSGAASSLATRRVFLLGLLAITLYFSFRILAPFLNSIVLGALAGSIFHPAFRRLRTWLGGRENAAAILICVAVLALVLGPLAFLVGALVGQGVDSAQSIQAWADGGGVEQALAHPAVIKAKSILARTFPGIDPSRIDWKGMALGVSKTIGQKILAQAGALLSGTGAVLGQFLLMLFVLFYVLRDGERILRDILSYSPLRAEQETKLLLRIRAISKSAILGTLVTAIAQGIAGGIGLAIAGISPLFWGAMMAAASLIPVVGTAIIWVPSALFLFVTGHPGKALFLALWSVIVVGSLDNFIRPVLMRGEAGMSTVWIFFSILGGIQLFGLLGVIYGPLVFGMTAVLLFLYRLEFHELIGKSGGEG